MLEEQKTDINELFSRDPLDLTDDDIDEIIAAMRERRHLFNSMPAKSSGSRTSAALTDKQKAASKLKIELDL